MGKLIVLAVIVFLFLQTPFFKNQVVPQYKDFEATMTKLLSGKPEDIKQRRYPATDPSHSPTQRVAAPSQDNDPGISSFMPKSTSTVKY